MTRYNNPLPQNSARPANAPPEADSHAWGVPPTQPPRRPQPQPGYGDPNGYAPDPRGAQHHDPYAALRPDGYGYTQPPAQQPVADPYGLAGYTAPQQPAAQSYAARPSQPAAFGQPQPGYDAYAGGTYGHAPQPAAQPQSYTPQPVAAQSGYGSQATGYGYSAPAQAGGYAARADALNPLADHWGTGAASPDPRGFGGHSGGLGQHQWDGADQYGTQGYEPSLGSPQAYQNSPQQAQGSFDQSYADEDGQYEPEPRRGGWKKAAVLVACTVVVGGVLTYGYSSIMGTGSGEPTPLVKGAQGPSKVKPSEPGGKQFAHTDSKILGRLGEGGAAPADEPDTGVRKVPLLTVGRDGSIQPPAAAAPKDETRAVVAVPGMTVIDGLGGSPGGSSPAAASAGAAKAVPPVKMVTASEQEKPVVVAPPDKQKKSPNLIAAAEPDAGAAVPTKAAVVTPKATPPAPKKEKVAVAAVAPPVTSDAPVGPQPTGAGYVAVLASVPASDKSRIDALKQFADMQQKYGVILQNKTPDVQEANLGAKGTYHRLLVGPPGSRDSASQVCTQLKAEGYSGCWVTAY